MVVTNSCNFFLNLECTILKGNLRKELIFEPVVCPTLDLTKRVEIQTTVDVVKPIDCDMPVTTNNLKVVKRNETAISE